MNLDKALDVEQKYHLNDLNIDGYHYWTMFRFQMIQAFHTVVDGTGQEHHTKPETFKARMRSNVIHAINTLSPKYYHYNKADYLFVSGGRRVLNNGTYENTIIDPIMKEYENSVLLEYSLGGIHLTPASSKHVVYHDRIGLIAGVSSVLNRKFRASSYQNIKNGIVKSLEEPLEEMQKAYGVKVQTNSIINNMTDFYYQYMVYRKRYTALINKIAPKVIVMIVSYDSPKMIFTEIAKEKGIPVVELQHGSAGSEHPGYNYSEGEKIKQFPDYYLAFSEFWRNQAGFPIPHDRLIAVGSPFSERRALNTKRSVNESDKKMILFLSQPNHGESFSRIAAKLQEIIDKDKYRIVFKMHPSESNGWKSRYPELYASGCEVLDNSNSDLYQLMADADFVIAIGNTTALYEALLFTASAYVYYPESMVEFRALADEGLVGRFDTPEELYEKILNTDTKKDTSASFWEKDSLNKMKEAIAMIRS